MLLLCVFDCKCALSVGRRAQACIVGAFKKGALPSREDLGCILRAGGAHTLPVAEALSSGADLAIIAPGRPRSDPQVLSHAMIEDLPRGLRDLLAPLLSWVSCNLTKNVSTRKAVPPQAALAHESAQLSGAG